MESKKCRKCGKDLISGTYNYTAGICDKCIEEKDKIKKPVEVTFKTKDGNEVSFKGTKIERKKNEKKNIRRDKETN